MSRISEHLGVLGLAVGMICLLTGCSESDDPVGPGGGGGDTTAPMVSAVSPGQNEIGVDVDAVVTVTFNEDMDQQSHAGQITLSSGTITDLTWTTARVLTIAHTDWAAGAEVTVTVGTGLSDAAGNQLAAAFTATFYVASPTLVFLASDPAHGADGVNRNARIELLFSAPMDLASLGGHLTLRNAASDDLAYALMPGEDSWLVVDPDETLPANETITLLVAAGAEDSGGRALADPVTVSFTTGDEVDTTPPTITSIVPASGSTIPASTTSIVMTFSEPVQPQSVTPTEMGAEFWGLVMDMDSEPLWSQDNTVLTIPLPAPLPAGMPLWATFAGYSDANGVVQDQATGWSVTVAGTPDYYPLVDDGRYVYAVSYDEGLIGDDDPIDSGTWTQFIAFEAQGGGIWHKVEYDETYANAWGWDIMDRTATALRMHGFHETGDGGQTTTFTAPIDYLRLPPAAAATWEAQAGVVDQDGFQLVAEGLYVEQLDRLALPADRSGPLFLWTDVWVATLSYTMEVDGEAFQEGSDTLYLAPGVGPVRIVSQERDLQEGTWRTSDRWLHAEPMR